jgi:beta-glucosidase
MKILALFVFFLFLGSGFKTQKKKENQSDFQWMDISLPLDDRIDEVISAMTFEEKISQLKNANAPIPRLGIQEYDW